MNNKPRVLVAHSELPTVGVELLKTKCDVTVMAKKASTTDDILKILPDYDALLAYTPIDAKFLDTAGKRLKVIATTSAGYDHMDIAEIKRRGIKVGHVPNLMSPAVAELAVFLLLAAARRTHEGRLYLLLEQEKTVIGYQWLLGHDLRNSTVGIVGLGSIGKEIIKRLSTFDVKRFIYTGHSPKKAGDEYGAEFVTLDAVLKESDFIISTAPFTAETDKMFNDETFRKMKNTAVFVNVGRGRTVDTEALVRALKNKTIFAAGLDVTYPEPLPPDHELMKLPNAIITPHIGGRTVGTRNDVSLVAAQSIINALEGKPMIFEL